MSILIGCTENKTQKSIESELPDLFQESIDSIFNANPEIKGIMVHVESPSDGISWSGAVGFGPRGPDLHEGQGPRG